MSQRVKGAVQQARGSVKAATGKLTGNAGLEFEGHVERLLGALRSVVGRLGARLKGR